MKFLKTIAVSLLAISLMGCEDQLDTKSVTASNTANFPATISDAEMLVTSMYANMNHMAAQPTSSYYFAVVLASDDCYGGAMQSFDHLMIDTDTRFDFCWQMHYKGVYLSNTAIEGLLMMKDNYGGTESYDQMLGESYFMRAYYYYELAGLFGGVPLIVSTTQEVNSPRASVDEVYGQIGSDLLNAIQLMSGKPYNALVAAGHATKWAAEALLARTWLFYTGFYGKDSMPSDGDGSGSITKTDVTAYVNDCVQNSGHDLVGDFRNLWPYTNEYTKDDYAYTKDVTGVDGKPLLWAGNGNPEEVFSIKFCNFCGYTYPNQEGYSNFYIPFFGFKGANGGENTFPFGNGNGFGTVTTTLWDTWDEADLRRQASILRVEDELDMDKYASGSVTRQNEDTGLWNKKMMPILSKKAYERQGSWVNSIFWAAYPEFDKANNYGMTQWGGHFQDFMIIRFADVLLMQSELTGDPAGMNRVRARAGLPAVGYSLDALQNERRHELAFEGVRWDDMRRWGIAEQALDAQNGVQVSNSGLIKTMRDGKYVQRYKATGGLFPLPLAQIQLSNGVLTQNPGWDTPDARYTRWEVFE